MSLMSLMSLWSFGIVSDPVPLEELPARRTALTGSMEAAESKRAEMHDMVQRTRALKLADEAIRQRQQRARQVDDNRRSDKQQHESELPALLRARLTGTSASHLSSALPTFACLVSSVVLSAICCPRKPRRCATACFHALWHSSTRAKTKRKTDNRR
jgi:hypothetical protein